MNNLGKQVNAVQEFIIIIGKLKKILVFLFFITGIINALILVISFYSYFILGIVTKTHNLNLISTPTFGAIIIYIIIYSMVSKKRGILININKIIDQINIKYLIKAEITSNAQVSSIIPGRKIIQDIQIIKNFITSSNGLLLLFEIPWSLFFLLLIWYINKLNGIICACVVIILTIISIIQYKNYINRHRAARSWYLQFNNFLEQVSDNYSLIKGMNLYKKIQNFIHDKRIFSNELNLFEENNHLTYFTKFIKSLTQISIFIININLYLQHQLTIGGLIVISIIIGKVLYPFDNILYAILSYRNVTNAYHKLYSSVINVLNNEILRMNKYENNNNFFKTSDMILSVINLSFMYNKQNNLALNNVSFECNKNNIISIIGTNNSGKSTLLKLIANIIEQSYSGQIVFNLTNLEMNSIGYLSENIKFLPVSIKDIISNFNNKSELNEIINIAKILDVHNAIISLPNGYNTIIIDDNYLSASLRMKIALAALLYNNFSLIILDDPLSKMDSNYDQFFAQLLLSLKKQNKTIIITTAKQCILDISDKIIMLKEGEIVDF